LRLFRVAPAATALAIASALASCSQPAGNMVQPTSASAVTETAIVPVARIGRTTITARTLLTAEFQPFQEIEVMAKVAGYLRSIKVDLGDHVREGQVLAELEIPEMNDEVARAAAMVEQTGAEIQAAADELQRTESAHQIAHISFARLQEVAKREPGLIPQQELDEIHSRDLMAEAQVASAKSKMRVEQQKTRVARADETRLKTLRNYVTITAPFSGTVTKRYANSGSMIQSGIASQSQAMPLVRLSQISTLRLSLPVPESLVSTISAGQMVQVHVKSMGRNFDGRVARFSAKVDWATRTMVTEVDVPNSPGLLMPGMYAEVSMETKKHEDVLAAPLEAIERAGAVSRVYAVDKSGMVRILPVQLGLEDSGRVEIVSGLQEGDYVVTGRRAGLNAGDKVTPRIADSAQ
jgi:RND family efflux transporter MFP subunit